MQAISNVSVYIFFLFVSFTAHILHPSMLGWTITVYFLSLQLWISSKSCSGSWRSSETDIAHKKHQYWWKTILIYICIRDLLFCFWHQVCQSNFAKFLVCSCIIFYKYVFMCSLIIWACTILSNMEISCIGKNRGKEMKNCRFFGLDMFLIRACVGVGVCVRAFACMPTWLYIYAERMMPHALH